ncbi:MAG TPA: hypothetical protein VGP62_22085 [Bryobacteraceae bacterium]|jgi:hypothetical protein|nr:hypothetical protein [Bryobacteraceae bacterium]
MDWRALLVTMRLRAPDPAQPPEPIEPPHTHEECIEPEELSSYAHPTGGGPFENTKPSTVTVGGTAAMFLQCWDNNRYLLGGNGGSTEHADFTVTIREGSPSSLKRRSYDFSTPGTAKPIVGSRFELRFHNLGAAVHIFVPATVPLTAAPASPTTTNPENGEQRPASNPRLQLVGTGATPAEPTSPFNDILPTVAGRPVEVTYRDRVGYATYDVVDSDPKALHEATINVYVAYICNTTQNLPELGVTDLTTTFTPDPLSQAVETQPRMAFGIHACSSALLFPFVTNQGGLDTRIVVANTSLDPFGTGEERGTVKLYFFSNGDAEGGNPRPVVTQTIPAGKQLDFNISTGGNFGMPPIPGFQGYIIANANFRHSHGLALISGTGGQAAASYPAVRLGSRTGFSDPEA